ncbi:MAG TPA: protocatechuate 3,4-dioxygenase subunit alpha [Casimicrobiaceae bacterium]|nr:protocatechuate 3,4-dioxygenase subunit alpha [Casimicrobiaceae bacterium]
MSASGTPEGARRAQSRASEAPADRTYLETTSSQTVGPYLHIGLTWLVTDDLVGPGTSGEAIVIEGRITDADGKPVDDALIEIWQANAHGRYDHPDDARDLPLEPGFKGFGRVPTDAGGAFRFRTIKPGAVPAADGSMQAPHVNVTIFMRGMLKHLATRIYFPGEPANATDPLLGGVPVERRDTLIAKRAGDAVLHWNVVLHGAGETVFLEY